MKNKFALFVILLIGIVCSYRLFQPGYFSMQDDMHVFRLSQFHQCVLDRQIPCRYISQGGLGYGYPLFNFYSPAPYILGEIFHLVGFSFIDSIKIVFIITSFIRPLGIYLLASLLFGQGGGLIAAIVFSLAPYQAINSFVRGAIAENLALSLLPFVFWSLLSKRYYLYTIFLSILALTHNLTLLYVAPLIILFTVFFQRKESKKIILSSLLSFGISAFFLLPAFFEKQFTTVTTMTQGYFNFVNHFATLKQLFINHDWGFGASLWGPIDDMSFQIGYLQWILPIIALLTIIKSKHKKFSLFFLIIGIFSLFLTHNKSTFIWLSLPFMSYYQFPWRFLGLAIFCFSLVSANLINFKPIKKFQNIFIIFVLSIELLLNFSYFKEDIWYSKITDKDILSQESLVRQSGAGLKDYWPKFGNNFPTTFATEVETLNGQTSISNFVKKSNHISTTIDVTSETALIKLPVVYFPIFLLTINGQKSSYFIDNDLGLINIELVNGKNNIDLFFTNTTIRTISNMLSIVSITLFISLLIYEKRKNK